MHRQRHARSIQNQPNVNMPLFKNASNVAEQLLLMNNAIKNGEELNYNDLSMNKQRPVTIYSGELDTSNLANNVRNIAS